MNYYFCNVFPPTYISPIIRMYLPSVARYQIDRKDSAVEPVYVLQSAGLDEVECCVNPGLN